MQVAATLSSTTTYCTKGKYIFTKLIKPHISALEYIKIHIMLGKYILMRLKVC